MSTGTILDRILETKRAEVQKLRARHQHLSKLISACVDLPPTRGFKAALLERKDRNPERKLGVPALIAEVKKASPSKGIIREDFDPVAIAQAYHAGGAACLSVLTDEEYFQGSLSYLLQIREAVPLPLLRKDFLIDTAQVYESRLAGADAILLIVSAIPAASRLAEMRTVAESLGLDVLVEVHDRAECDIAVESGATLIGVNNRDLKTFDVRLETFEALRPNLPPETVAVAESGIFTNADVMRMNKAGADAVLVGESLMRVENIKLATQKLLQG